MAQTPPHTRQLPVGPFPPQPDELTLEMVTDDEEIHVLCVFGGPSDAGARGDPEELAPLVDNNARRIELLNSILFSFPGTPINLLRRRDRDGRQHLPGTERRAHAHAVDIGPQRGFSSATRRGCTYGNMDPIYGYR